MNEIINNFIDLCESKPSGALIVLAYLIVGLFCSGIIIEVLFDIFISGLIKYRDKRKDKLTNKNK